MKLIFPIVISALLILNSCVQKKEDQNLGDPTGRKYYAEQHRPQYHFSPESKWMNDPNGMVLIDGIYHLFYQYYPDSTVWGPMHWGHASSKDLIHWEHKPIALYPDEHGYIYSGSAVYDIKNTSGLGSKENPPVVAVFTYHDPIGQNEGRDDFENQGIAYSLDKGETWKKYEGNPVLLNPGIRDFRDPKVTFIEEIDKWIMTLAVQDHVSFYSSPNLIDWTFESDFGKEAGAHGGVWECPELVILDAPDGNKKYVLIVSVNPGGPNLGSGTQYFLGDFDGTLFHPDDSEIRWIDYGPDNYAGVTWSNTGDRTIFIGWMSNWLYAQLVPTDAWRSAMTIPRELSLKETGGNLKLISKPVNELKILRKDSVAISPEVISGIKMISLKEEMEKSVYELELRFKFINSSQTGIATEFGLHIGNEENEFIEVGINVIKGYMYIDRRSSGKKAFSDKFADLHTAPIEISEAEEIALQVFVDKSSVEVFLNNGEQIMTEIFFPNKDFDHITLIPENGSIELISGTIYSLHSIW